VSEQHAIAHLPDGSIREIPPADISELLVQRGALLWLDIAQPSEDDLALLHREFRFHELSLEDALRREQRPKCDEYEGYYFLVVYSASLSASNEIATHEIHCFWGGNYFVTLHQDPIPEIHAAIQRWATSHEDRRHGVAYQVYALLDAVIDGYFPALDAVAERIDDLENRVFAAHPRDVIQDCFNLRRELLTVRRMLSPARDLLSELIRRDVPVFPVSLTPYLVDVYDHAIRLIDNLDVQRDLLSTVVESHLSVTSNRLNQTMKTLTALTVGIMVPTLIAGIYGMNFKQMPELEWAYGYPAAIGLMVVSAAAVLIVFKRVEWL
jgi:magnesium transporter